METENKIKNNSVKTYTEDMTKALEGDKGSLIRKIIEEEEKHEDKNRYIYLKSKRNRIFMFSSILFIFLSIGILVFSMFLKKEDNLVSIASQYKSLIFTDKTDFMSLDGLSKEKIEEAVYFRTINTEVKKGGIEALYLTENKQVIGLRRLANLLKIEIPEEYTNIIKDNILIGVMNNGTDLSSGLDKKGFFTILSVNSLSDAFQFFKAWERKMLYDFYGFLGLELSSDTNYLFTKDFEDGIVNNKNARILKDLNGSIILMYVFIDDEHIVLANSEETVGEIILRFASSKIKK